MKENLSNNKKIAKNSVYLYCRTFISIIVTLYTSRVFLQQLGIEDYGIYNLVGGVVAMLSVLTNMMANATQRFLSIEIGRNDIHKYERVLNISITLHIIIFIIFLLLGESIGLWFLANKLNIPEGKENVTYFVFHFAILTGAFSLLKVPYNALIIAKERMSFYAYISIVEVIGKLIITLSLVSFTEKLKIYSVSFFLFSVLIVWIYYEYCKKRIGLPSCKFERFKETPEYKQILSFSSWSFLGNFATTARDQGVGFILNIFLGVLLNAAMGIMLQIANVYSSLFLNLQAAFRPQIIQNSVNDRQRYMRLVCICTNYTILLMGIVCIPMVLACRQILTLWLGIVPEFAVCFVQLLMFKILFAAISQSVSITLDASAKIKTNQVVSILLSVFSLVFMYTSLLFKFHPSSVIIILVSMELLLLFYKLYYSNEQGCLRFKELFIYCKKTFLFVLITQILSLFVSRHIDSYIDSLIVLVVFSFAYLIVVLSIIEKSHRLMIMGKINGLKNKIIK